MSDDPKIFLRQPFGAIRLSPNEETHVLCPLCSVGMIPASTSVEVTRALRAVGLLRLEPHAPSSGE